MRLAQFFCTSTSQDLSVSFHLSALMTTSRSHRAASTIHRPGRAEFLLLGTCRGPSGSYSSPISKRNLQNLVIFTAKCGKFFCFCGKVSIFLWQNLANFVISNGNFHEARVNTAELSHPTHKTRQSPFPKQC